MATRPPRQPGPSQEPCRKRSLVALVDHERVSSHIRVRRPLRERELKSARRPPCLLDRRISSKTPCCPFPMVYPDPRVYHRPWQRQPLRPSPSGHASEAVLV